MTLVRSLDIFQYLFQVRVSGLTDVVAIGFDFHHFTPQGIGKLHQLSAAEIIPPGFALQFTSPRGMVFAKFIISSSYPRDTRQYEQVGTGVGHKIYFFDQGPDRVLTEHISLLQVLEKYRGIGKRIDAPDVSGPPGGEVCGVR